MISNIYNEIKSHKPRFSHSHLNTTFSVASAILVLIVYGSVQSEKRMIAAFGEHTVISDFGIMLFAITSFICIFTRYTFKNELSKSIKQFLLYTALFTAFLLLDDYFSFHEYWVPKYFNIKEKTYYIGLAAFTLFYFLKIWKTLLKTNYIVLLLSLSCLSMSVLGDGVLAIRELLAITGVVCVALCAYLIVYNRKFIRIYAWSLFMTVVLFLGYVYLSTLVTDPEYVLEEGFKWLGIASWCSYYSHSAYLFIMMTKES
ncbi:MAG: hypothetical protein ACPHLK_03440 [Gammaproteobacteria bacterium]|jgi:hypothetical protein